jgi:hypothetical protein
VRDGKGDVLDERVLEGEDGWMGNWLHERHFAGALRKDLPLFFFFEKGGLD